eukprot:CAMPEP_0174840602 /NCGR_PEP_ID=MMETSP1114-20130205/8787_1 /TAXON_ID=312471 /ORGANISM="Neobodo designis, Strain CCAP 1951/1" /LENGTH=465 /DNA_ID=CAMNT_0016074759 /DNA_START=40 /DNA_END=1434 /DNA_ORIENTATION=-
MTADASDASPAVPAGGHRRRRLVLVAVVCLGLVSTVPSALGGAVLPASASPPTSRVRLVDTMNGPGPALDANEPTEQRSAIVTMPATVLVEAPPAADTKLDASGVKPVTSRGPRGRRCRAISSGHDMEMLLSDAPRCAVKIFADAAATLRAEDAPELIAARPAENRLRERVPEIDAVYMVHYTGTGVADAKKRASAMDTARRRRSAMASVFGNHSMAIDTWVTALDREALGKDDIACIHRRWEPAEYRLPRKAKRHETQKHEMLKPTQVSVNSKHHLALYDLVAQGHGLALVVEDDVLFHACFADHLRALIDSLRPNATASPDEAPTLCHSEETNAAAKPRDSLGFDVLWIGGCMNMHAYRRKRKMAAPLLNPHAYLKTEARCAHAYLVTNRAAVELLQSMPLTLPIDFQITSAMRERGLRSVWAEPWLSIQGDFGECVTMELGAGCVSKEKYTRQFDEAFASVP